MTALSLARRLTVALTGITCAALLFRSQIASSLITRGDDLLRAGDLSGAVRAYERAVRIDARSTIGADRLAFYLLVRRGHGDAADAFAIAGAALRSAPHDAALNADRAFAAERLGQWRDAERDFSTAAGAARDPRYFHLAARMAERANDRRSAEGHLYAALALDPHDGPARAALHRLGK